MSFSKRLSHLSHHSSPLSRHIGLSQEGEPFREPVTGLLGEAVKVSRSFIFPSNRSPGRRSKFKPSVQPSAVHLSSYFRASAQFKLLMRKPYARPMLAIRVDRKALFRAEWLTLKNRFASGDLLYTHSRHPGMAPATPNGCLPRTSKRR